ncbi:MAG: T9SS type A sorting domain-containing protein, partial [bacterium]
YVRDKVAASPQNRNVLVKKVVYWFENVTNIDITDVDETPKAYSLAQKFPNPFNTNTTIKFNMREKGHVTVRVYNVAGQLVRTLVNEVRDAGPHSIDWKGRNDSGKSVASGVYFYKMDTKNFVQTRKMVLLR